MKKLLAFFLPNLRGDGAVRMMLVLAEGFSRDGYQVDVLVARNEGESAALLPDNVRLVDLSASRSLMAVLALARYLRKHRPEILFATEHYSGFPALYALMIARTSTPCVIRQDNTWSMDMGRAQWRHRAVNSLVARLLFPKAHLIAVSKGVATDIAEQLSLPPRRITVIYNPVISPRLEMLAKQPVDHPWFGNDDIPVILAIGRLAPAKGFDVLISAFAELIRHTPARLLILGEGPERHKLESLVSSLGLADSCQLPGYESNPYRFLSRASAFVLSSRFEGLPTVLIEALSLNAPVVATDCPSGPREILDNGRFGTLVEPENPHALCTALLNVISSPPKPHSEALSDWLEQFTYERSIAAHLEFAENIVKEHQA